MPTKSDIQSPVGRAALDLSEALVQEMNGITRDLLPVVREYLIDIRNVRMAIEAEVRSMLQTAATLRDVTKANEELQTLSKSLVTLRSVLTPEFVELLERFSTTSKEKS